MKILDLYSGLGGASEAFYQAGHDVIRIDNNPLLEHIPNTKIADASFAYNYLSQEKFDLIWASPPCLEFSNAFNAPKPKAAREGREFEPNLDEVKKAMNIIEFLEPRYWIIENVVGAIKDFEPLLGEPTQIIGAYVLWGHFPQLIKPSPSPLTGKTAIWKIDDPLRANKRALIPYGISLSVLDAVATPTLGDYV